MSKSQLLNLDYERETMRICDFIRAGIVRTHKRQGAVVAVSGGVDSSTALALCVRALGPDHVFALILPERDSAPDTEALALLVLEFLRVPFETTDITPILEAMGCYRFRDEAIRHVFPDYGTGYRCHLLLRSSRSAGKLAYFYDLIIEDAHGTRKRRRLPLMQYLQIMAATNMKQRTRKSLEYFHADRLNYAVVGTPNFVEYHQGFFVRQGDGAADIKPLAHLYKSQVYGLAKYLGLPQEVLAREPTTDTFSLTQSQRDFFFQLDFDRLDLILNGLQSAADLAQLSEQSGLPVEELEWVIRDIERKHVAAEILNLPPLSLVPPQPVTRRIDD